MPAAPPRRPGAPRPASARALWRHALEGALSTLAAAVAMAAAVWAALALLGAGAIAPASRLVPTVVGMAFGGGVTVTSAASVGSGGSGGGEGLGGLDLGLTGAVSVMPLTVTFLGTAVLALGFFRPLYRRPQPASELLWARFGGALAAAAVVFPLLAGTAHGTARLPEDVARRFGRGEAAEGLGGLGGGGLADGLSSAAFEIDVAVTVFFGLLWVCAVLGIGCVAARRTTPSRHLALGQARRSWHAVTSALSGIAAVLCSSVLVLALVAGLAALTGREQAAKAAGALLLVGPNLLVVLLTAGLGTPWGAGVQRLTPEGGGMLGGLGGPATDRSVDLRGWSAAGLPLWLIGLLLALVLAVIAGYLSSARTPARTRQEEARAVFGRNAEIAMRLGTAVGVPFLLLPLAARGSVGIGVDLMGREVGGVAAGLDGSPGLSALGAVVLAAVAGYGGILLHGRRARRPELREQSARAERPARSPRLARAAASSRGSSGSAS
ncbi:streptophobe family protein [Kitasatospora sp. NPDC056184]|uniref:streptophobe family protein n=1 Tax=Kitasatospora sp. NPDC056184 TaxID=3345738 RepID=UPI0035DC17C2